MPEDSICAPEEQASRKAVEAAEEAARALESAWEDFIDTAYASTAAATAMELGCVGAGFVKNPMGGFTCVSAISAWWLSLDLMSRRAEKVAEARQAVSEAMEDARAAMNAFKHCLEDASEDAEIVILD